tara:strand:- start:11218 stop:11679 length:462 start_codon:yes stop_codon:yes gene_type:complete
MRLVTILYSIIGTFAVRKFNTCNLKNQFKKSIKWNDYTHIIICDQTTHSDGIKWGQTFLDQGINEQSICVIAPVPKWMTQAPGYKTIIRKAVIHLEDKVPVFIDWERDVMKLNNIDKVPTIIIVYIGRDGKLYEKARASGKYSKRKYKKLIRH